jgi:hypothetical protein
MPDFDITDLGTIVMFQPLNEAAEAWWHEYINAEPWQYEPSGACSIDRRYAADIIDVLQEEGFSIKEP